MGTPVPCVRSSVTVCPTIQPCYLLVRYMKDLGTASGVVMSQVESAAVPTLADLALVAAGHRVCTHLALSGGGVYATVGNPHYHPNAPSGSFMPPMLGRAKCGSHTKLFHPAWDGPNRLPPGADIQVLHREFGAAVTGLLEPLDLSVCNMTLSPCMSLPRGPVGMCYTGTPVHRMYWHRPNKRRKKSP